MKKIYNNVLWGIALVAAGLIVLANSLGFISINLFFDGWWTLFIIIPAISGLFNKGSRLFSFIALMFGVTMLLEKQGLIQDGLVFPVTLSAVIIAVGVNLIYSSFHKSKWKLPTYNKLGLENYVAVFSGQERKYVNEPFPGADIVAIFGEVDLDLREAIINGDVRINVNAIFGGCDLIVPSNVTVKTSETNVFGGVENKTEGNIQDGPTIYISSTTVFGGLTVKNK